VVETTFVISDCRLGGACACGCGLNEEESGAAVACGSGLNEGEASSLSVGLDSVRTVVCLRDWDWRWNSRRARR